MEIIQEKNSRKGLIGTILFHLLLLILFLFVGMAYPDPPPPEEGITINFGASDEGMGEEQPENPTNEATNESESVESETTTSAQAEEQLTTQNHTETVEVNASENNTTQENTTEEQTASQSLSEALNAFNNAESSANSNEGETGNPGDQGSIDGDPNSSNHTGGGIGNGVTYSLSGRNLISTPKIEDNSQEQGKVVVDIIVDKNGKVVKATPGGRGSTTTSAILYKKAKEAALKTKFNAKPDLLGDQKGQMTFVFILN